jgi:hypothetical protein
MKSRNIRGATFPSERPWTSREVAELRRLASLGVATAAELLGRSASSVRAQAHRLGLSMRRPGESRGLVIGQPRAVSFVDTARAARRAVRLRAYREDVLAGRVDPHRVVRRLRSIDGPLARCPACGVRPQEVPSSGFCEDCHLRALAQAHSLETGRAEAEDALDRERQRKHRRKEGQK